MHELDIETGIDEFAQAVLGQDVYRQARNLCHVFYQSTGHRNHVKKTLAQLLKCQTVNRPITYCLISILHLPNSTRDLLRYLGDYLAILSEEWLSEYLDIAEIEKRARPFGAVLKALEKHDKGQHDDLITKLKDFNMITYRPAKHDFRHIPSHRKHRFSVEEAILLTFVAAKLAEKICDVSKKAKEYQTAEHQL